MLCDRRQLLIGSGAALVARVTAWAGGTKAADARAQGVFWKVTPPGGAPTILFGQDDVAVTAASNLLATGQRLAMPTRHLIAAVPTTHFPVRRFDIGKLLPFAERYGPATGQRLIVVLKAIYPNLPNPEKLGGTIIASMLTVEGRTPNNGVTLPAYLFADIYRSGEATSYLFTYEEIAHFNFTPDLLETERRVDREVIDYLLDLRARFGPVGKHMETLYIEERLYDLWRFRSDLVAHGVPFLGMDYAPLDVSLVDRAIRAVRAAQKPTFLMAPFGNFVRDDGILARLAHAGIAVEPVG